MSLKIGTENEITCMNKIIYKHEYNLIKFVLNFFIFRLNNNKFEKYQHSKFSLDTKGRKFSTTTPGSIASLINSAVIRSAIERNKRTS